MAVKSVDSGDFPEATVRYPTPGPQSYGHPDHVAQQRADLGLPAEQDDPEPTPEAKVVEAPEQSKPAGKSKAQAK